jgi:hypothetical protein
MKKAVFSLALPLALTVSGFSAQAVQAQISPAQLAQQNILVSLSVRHATVSTALQTLFQQARIHNYVIDAQADGRINANFHEMPLALALRKVLSASVTPLMVDIEEGVYHVRVSFLDQTDLTGQMRFYKIGINHYDAGMLARLIAHQNGLVDVPPNFVVTANLAAAAVTTSQPTNTPVVPGTPGSPPSAPYSVAPMPSLVPQAEMPEGVKRIFALQSDNSLVIEATPKGFASLTDLQLASEGYEPVF